jgi:hypothetical protein
MSRAALLCEKNNVVIFRFVQNLLCGQSVEFMNSKLDGAIGSNNGNL